MCTCTTSWVIYSMRVHACMRVWLCIHVFFNQYVLVPLELDNLVRSNTFVTNATFEGSLCPFVSNNIKTINDFL